MTWDSVSSNSEMLNRSECGLSERHNTNTISFTASSSVLLTAKYLPKGEESYTMCGTPNYLAPEVVMNRGHSYGVDHWALGVLIYEMVMGENPFCT